MKNIATALLLLISTLCFAAVPQPGKNTYVNDFAHVLTKKQVMRLNKRIYVLEKKTSVQLAVVLVNNIPPEYTIEDYALLIGRKWHVGVANNGAVYVAAIRQHKQRLEVADNLQKYISDDKAASILNWVKIDLKYKMYGDAMNALVDKVDESIAYSKATLAQAKVDSLKNQKEATRAAVLKTEQDRKANRGVKIAMWIVGTLLFGRLAFFLVMLLLRFIFPGLFKGIANQSGPVNSGQSYSRPLRAVVNTVSTRRRNTQYGPYIEDTYPDHSSHRSHNAAKDNNDKDDHPYGNWGSSSNGSSSSSSNSGFNGGGASSDW